MKEDIWCWVPQAENCTAAARLVCSFNMQAEGASQAAQAAHSPAAQGIAMLIHCDGSRSAALSAAGMPAAQPGIHPGPWQLTPACARALACTHMRSASWPPCPAQLHASHLMKAAACPPATQMAGDDDDEGDSSSDDEDDDMEEDGAPEAQPMQQQEPQQPAGPVIDEDGFELVQSKRKGKR
jgi:hypothetical protein